MKSIMTINTINTGYGFVHELKFRSEDLRQNFYEAIDSVFSFGWTPFDSDSKLRTAIESGMILGNAYHNSTAIIIVDDSNEGSALEDLNELADYYTREINEPDNSCPEFNKAVKDYIRIYKKYKANHKE